MKSIVDYTNKLKDFFASKQALTNTISPLINKKYVVISDSYGNYTNPDGRNFVSEAFHMLNSNDFYDFHGGGAGFTATLTFLTVLQTHESAISDKTSITDFIVCGAANDFGASDNDIRVAMENFRDYVTANYPNAKIHCGAFSKTLDSQFIANNTPTIENYKKCSIQARLAYIDNSEWVMCRQSYFRSADAVHPTDSAIYALGRALANFVLHGSISIHDNLNNCFKMKDSNVGTINDQTRQIFNNGVISLTQRSNVSNMTITLANDIPMNSGTFTYTGLLEFNDTFIFPISNNSNGILCTVENDGHFYFGMLYFKAMTNYLVQSIGLLVHNDDGIASLKAGALTIAFSATSINQF